MDFNTFIERWRCQKFRFETSRDALRLCHERGAKTFVETGCVKKPVNEGHVRSTVLYADFIDKLVPDGRFWTVDIDPKSIEIARRYTKDLAPGRVCCTVGDSVEFLQAFDERIDFVYLDSLGWLGDNFSLESTRHQVKELEAIEDQIHQDTVILLDDNLAGYGRTILSVPWLRERGWDVYSQGHQVVLVHLDSEFSPPIEEIREAKRCGHAQRIFQTDRECNWHEKHDWSDPRYT